MEASSISFVKLESRARRGGLDMRNKPGVHVFLSNAPFSLVEASCFFCDLPYKVKPLAYVCVKIPRSQCPLSYFVPGNAL